MNGWAADRHASLQLAFTAAQKAISLSPELPLSYFVTGLVQRERGEYVKAMVEADKAIARDPNYANAHVLLATLLYYAGRPEESVERLRRAMRLNPHHPFNYNFHLGQAYFTLKRYEDAIATLQEGVASNPASERLHIWLAASFALAGKLDDAQWEAEQVKVLNPQFSVSTIAKSYPFKNDKDRKHFIGGLRKAGLT
jgi:adenylate cyclase